MNVHVWYAGWLRVGECLAVGAEGGGRVDDEATLVQRVDDGAGPAQAPHGRRVQRRHQRQVRIEVVHLTECLHYLQELARILLSLSGLLLSFNYSVNHFKYFYEKLHYYIRVNYSNTNLFQNSRACPVTHFVEMFCKARKVRRAFFWLVARP